MPVRFAEFTLDRDQRLLTRGEITVPLAGKAFDLLDLLVSERPKALSKERIRDQVWPRTFVSESTLNGLVAELRAALGTTPASRATSGPSTGSATRSPPRSSKSETSPRPPRGLRRRGSSRRGCSGRTGSSRCRPATTSSGGTTTWGPPSTPRACRAATPASGSPPASRPHRGPRQQERHVAGRPAPGGPTRDPTARRSPAHRQGRAGLPGLEGERLDPDGRQ